MGAWLLPFLRHPFVQAFIRFVIYVGIISGIFLLMYVDAMTTKTFGETSLVEISQSVILVVVTAIFATCAVRLPALRVSAWLLATFTAASLIRENDVWLDMLHDDGWQILVTPVILAGLFYTWKNRTRFLDEQVHYTQTSAFGLLMAALLTTYVFARFYGMGAFWKAVMQDAYLRNIKDMSEECLELFGYGILLCAALEFVVVARRLVRGTDPAVAAGA
ncbi:MULTISPECIES: hypothetical protein [unclassified Xanthobacter]|uniref:hypothetical protein n=1 Tax=unclassified Xanthobacter TaxID=2623496 RepID=UPI001EDD8FDE|nr:MULTISPECIES: hypothetical protein [unclassified Xanthobacter]